MPDLAALNACFGIPDALTFSSEHEEQAMIRIEHPHATARLSLQGAQVLDWCPRGERPVLWLSPAARYVRGQAIRGGIPICWPWFGPHPVETSLPSHGFARTGLWIVEHTHADDRAVSLRLRLLQDEATERLWPHACSLTVLLRIGRSLELELSTHNLGAQAISVSEALHAYFHVANLAGIAVHGLEGARYVDKTAGGQLKNQNGPLSFDGETDRIYTGSTSDCIIEDPGFRRRIRIVKRGSRSTIVWNPGAQRSAQLGDMEADSYLQMVCVESGNADVDSVTILPGDMHRLQTSYTVERID